MEQNKADVFGSYCLTTAPQLLCTEESCAKLTSKLYRLLLYSLLYSVRLISHEELFDAVWNQMLDTDEIVMF